MRNEHGEFKRVNGLVWPAYDTACAEVVFDSIQDLERALGYCTQKRTVIQAGGNCGVWARHLAGIFRCVWTWEPDQMNYTCLARNTLGMKNVFANHGALGAQPGVGVMIAPEQNNCGALQVDLTLADTSVRQRHGIYPVVVLDDYDPKEIGTVDLIYLDVEGYELPALQGATQLIERDRPIIAVEDKGLSERYGVAKGDVLRYLERAHNYEVIDQYARDYVLRRKPARSTG